MSTSSSRTSASSPEWDVERRVSVWVIRITSFTWPYGEIRDETRRAGWSDGPRFAGAWVRGCVGRTVWAALELERAHAVRFGERPRVGVAKRDDVAEHL